MKHVLFSRFKSRLLSPKHAGALAGLAFGLILTVAIPVSAATINVTNTNDTGANSLRNAIAAAAANDTIAFNLPANSTITVGSTLVVNKHLTIDGTNSSGLVISGGSAVRVFSVNAGVNARFLNFTIKDGKVSGDEGGGGVSNAGALTLANVTVTGNNAAAAGGGGPIPEGTKSDAQIMVNGTRRYYRLYTPSTINNPGATFPLIVALHGDNGSGPSFENDWGLDAVADANGGAIIAYPTASTGGINNGGLFTYWDTGLSNEAAFIDALVIAVQTTGQTAGKVTPGRVFLTGHSGGGTTIVGMFTNGLTTTAWKGVATHSSGGIWDIGFPDHPKSATFAALQVHGMNDSGYTSFAGGQGVRDYWIGGNGCINTTSTWDATVPYCVAYNCSEKPEVWCPIPGMGHVLWTSAYTPPAGYTPTNWAAQVTWKFFAQQ